jgi:hypothetical protein
LRQSRQRCGIKKKRFLALLFFKCIRITSSNLIDRAGESVRLQITTHINKLDACKQELLIFNDLS